MKRSVLLCLPVSSIDTEKYYSVAGKIIQSKGLEQVDSDVYFKVRLDQ